MMRDYGSVTQPLLEAIKMGQKDLAKSKLESGEYSDLDYQGENRDGTSLYWAAVKGYEDLVRFLLLFGAGVDVTTGWGASPLHAAADSDQDVVISILLANGADVDIRTSRGDTPCHLAAYRGSLKATRRLVEGGANIRLENEQGNDVMREAMQNRRFDVVKYLWSFLEADYKSPSEELKNIIQEPVVSAGNDNAILSNGTRQSEKDHHHHHHHHKRQHNRQKERSESRSKSVRRSSVALSDLAIGARQHLQQLSYPLPHQQTYPHPQQPHQGHQLSYPQHHQQYQQPQQSYPQPQRQTYPPTTRRYSGLPLPQEPMLGHRAPETPYGWPTGGAGATPRQPNVPFRPYFSSSALDCQLGAATPTPSEDEVDWDSCNSLCVDEDRYKTRLW